MDTGHEGCSFGMLLRAYRAERGLSQDGLAERAGLSMAAISALERGLTRWPYRDTVARLASAMELAPAERTALAVAGQRSVRAKPGSYASTGGVADSPDPGVPTAAGTFPRHTLPVPLSGLIGRDAELARLEEGLVRSNGIGTRDHAAESLEGLAELAATLGEPQRAARLYGAAAALRRAIGAPLPLRERAGHEQALAALRKRLGARRFALALASGECLSLDQAIAELRR